MKFLFLALLCVNAFASSLTENQKLEDLDQLVRSIKAKYGPIQFKETELGINVDILKNEYTQRIKATKNNSEFYYEIIKFVGEFKDGHFGAWLPTDHVGSVPFSTFLFDGKVLIEEIDRNKLSEKKFPFRVGDEIVSVDGQDIADFLDEYQVYRGSGSDLTMRTRAAYAVTWRRGRYYPVKDGEVVFGIRKGTSNTIVEVKLEWGLTGTPLDEFISTKTSTRSAKKSEYNPLMLSIREQMQEDLGPRFDKSYHCSGETRVEVPNDTTYIMKKPFVAYYYPTAKGNIGYLRIPHYSPQNAMTGDDEYELRFSQYEYAVSELEKNTVALVIDQDHNCGGSVLYLEKMLGLFMNTPYPPMGFTLLATKSEYLDFMNWLNDYDENTIYYQRLKSVTELIKDSWMKGEFMTPMTNLQGIDKLNPNQITYTKPILMLIDHQSGSGGDAFPSMMKGLGRAKLFGTQTAGLGGHVESLPALRHSGINLRITKSLFYKPNGDPVENNGAIPDIDYVTTRADLMHGYRDYREAYTKAILDMI